MSHTWVTKRKTRKPHKCWGCCEDIPVGSLIEFTVSVDGSFCSAYWCDVCSNVMDTLDYWEKQDGFAYGDIKNIFNEEWEKEKRKLLTIV